MKLTPLWKLNVAKNIPSLFYNNMTSIEEANPEALVKSEYGSLIKAIHHLPFLYIYLSLKKYSPHFCREHQSTGEYVFRDP